MKPKGALTRRSVAITAASVLAMAAVVATEGGTAFALTATTAGYAIGTTTPTSTGTATGTLVSQPSVWLSQTAAGATGVQYIIGFKATTAIAGGGTVTINAPAGTDFSNAQVTVVDATANTMSTLGPSSVKITQGAGSTAYNQLTVALPNAVAAGDTVFLELNGVTNPATSTYGGAAGNFTISTSADTATVEVPSYQVTSTNSAAQASLELTNPAPGALSQYRIGDVQAEAGLNAGATLQLQAGAGTVFPAVASDYSIVDLTNNSAVSTPTAVSVGGTGLVTLTLPSAISAGDYLEIAANGVINPVTAGNYTLTVTGDVTAAVPAVTTPVTSVTTPASPGYWLATASGYVYGVGGAQSLGNLTVTAATGPVVGIAATPDGQGYWLVTSNGTVAPFGDAKMFGDLPADGVKVSDIVAIAPTADGQGYWLVGRDGGMFSFGDAKFHGSIPGLKIKVNDIAGIVASPDAAGYLIVGTDGGVFSFGSSHFEGSLPGLGIHVKDIRAILPTTTGNGYVLVGSDGGAFVFGTGASFAGSLPGRGITVNNIVGIALTPDDNGYYMAGSAGTVYTFGDAQSFTAPAGLSAHLPVVAIAAT